MNRLHEIAADAGKQPKSGILVIGRILAAVVFLIGTATLAGSVYIVVRAYTPVWYFDEWGVPIDYQALGGHYPLWKFWAQHNEHRIPFMKALQILDMFWWKGDRRPLLLLNWIVQGSLWCVFVYFLRATRRFSRMELATLAGIAAFFVFNPNQLQNFNSFFQTHFVSAFLFAVIALAAISRYAQYEKEFPRKAGSRKWLTVAICSALLAEFNLANGILTWIMIPLCAALGGLRRRVVILLSGAAMPAIGVYLIGYQTPGDSSAPSHSLRNPGSTFAFVVTYFAESWHFVAARCGPAATVIALVLITFFVVRKIIRSERLDPVQGFALSVALTMLLTAFITALGRQDFGPEQARVERYQTPAMLFWWGLVLLGVATAIRVLKTRHDYRSYLFIVLQIVFLLIFVAEAGHYPELLAKNVSDGFMRSTAGLAVEAGIYDEAQIRSIFPRPSEVIPVYNSMLHAGLMTPPFREYYDVGKKLGQAFSMLPAGSCLGSTDLIHQVGVHEDRKQDLFAAGWGYFPAGNKAFKRVLAVTPGGTIAGVGVSGIRRPEIAAAHPEILTANTGWRLYAVSEGQASPLQVYGILPGTNRVCLLPGTQSTPASLPSQVLPPLSSISGTLTGYIEAANRAVVIGSNDANHPVRVAWDVNLVIEGWVLSGDGQSAMDQVFGVYPGGHVAGVPVARSDVVDVLKKGSLLMCGYRITIAAGTLAAGLQTIQIAGIRNDKYYKLPAVLYVLTKPRP